MKREWGSGISILALVVVFLAAFGISGGALALDSLGSAGGGPINGTLQVQVLHAGSGAPFAGAFVMAGDAPGSPFSGNWGSTSATGEITFTDAALQGPITVTAGAAGHRFVTMVLADASQLVLALEPVVSLTFLSEVGDYVSGVDVDNGTFNFGDGNVDVAFVLRAMTLDDMMAFDMDNMFGPEEIVDVLGQPFPVPSNVFIPSQYEAFINIVKDHYYLYLPPGNATLAALSGRMPLSELIAGGEMVDLLPHIQWREIDVLDITVAGSTYDADLTVDPDLSGTVTLNLDNIPDGCTGYGLSIGDLDGLNGLGRLVPLGMSSIGCPEGTGPCSGSMTLTTAAATGEFAGMGYFPAVAAQGDLTEDALFIMDRSSHSRTYTANLGSFYHRLDLAYGAGGFAWNDAENAAVGSPAVDLQLALIGNPFDDEVYWEFLLPGGALSLTIPQLPAEAPAGLVPGAGYNWTHSALGLTWELPLFDYNDFAFSDITAHVSHLATDNLDVTLAISGTVSATLVCVPSAGTVPFATGMQAALTNEYGGQSRRVAGRIDVLLAGGGFYANWRAGYTNLGPGESWSASWNTTIPALGSVIGENSFTLVAVDVTPSPFNQPPYPPDGDSALAVCTVTGVAP
jgi:hypothetical protein